MSKYELTISKNYVPEWGVKEAVRELFQNALDQEVVASDNKMFFFYDEDGEILEIGNKHSVLETSSLLLGHTTKLNDDLTIGQFGEGYKIAMLILLRNNIGMTLFNYGKKEVWKPRFVKSRRYKQDLLTVFTEKMVWSKPPENSLIIKLEGITSDMYEGIVKSNLHLQGITECKVSENYGKVLMDEKLRGKIFVNGLFVTEDTSLNYGYDFFPHVLKLKRDRSMISSFDLKSTITKVWSDIDEEDTAVEVAKMIVSGSSDVSLFDYNYTASRKVSSDVFDVFKEQNGENAIALRNDVDLELFMEEHPDAKPVVVSSSMHDIIKKDDRYEKEIEEFFVEVDRTPTERLEVWFTKLCADTYIDSETKEEFNEILEDIR